MTLRLRLALTLLIAAVPLYYAVSWFRADIGVLGGEYYETAWKPLGGDGRLIRREPEQDRDRMPNLAARAVQLSQQPRHGRAVPLGPEPAEPANAGAHPGGPPLRGRHQQFAHNHRPHQFLLKRRTGRGRGR